MPNDAYNQDGTDKQVTMRLNQFEAELVVLLRKKRVFTVRHPGNISVHYNKDLKPTMVEIREFPK